MLSLLKRLLTHLITLDIVRQTRLNKRIFINRGVVDVVLSKYEVWLSASNFFNNFAALSHLLELVTRISVIALFVSIITSCVKSVSLSEWKIALLESLCKLSSQLFTIRLVVVFKFSLREIGCVRT